MVVVFTLSDKKAEHLLIEQIRASGEDLTAANIKSHQPELKKMVQDYCLKEKERIVGQSKITRRDLRFAVLGGLAAQHPWWRVWSRPWMYLLQDLTKIRQKLHNSAKICSSWQRMRYRECQGCCWRQFIWTIFKVVLDLRWRGVSTLCPIDWSSALALLAVEAYFMGRMLSYCKRVMLVL